MAPHPRLIAAALAGLLCWTSSPVAAQRLEPEKPAFWVGSTALILGGVLLDVEARDHFEQHRSGTLDDAARLVDPFGRARYILPAISVTYVAFRLADRRDHSDAVVRIALGYLAADALGSVLKPAVGRQRPESTGGAWRFSPFDGRGEYHSLPSAHTVHAFALAAGIAEEANRPWVTVLAYGTATAVGVQRVYRGEHWASDVAVSAVLAVAVSKGVTRWMRARD